MRIPGGAEADLGTKIEDYVLNPLHREGRHKARVFESVLGITLTNADLLRSALRNAAASSTLAVHRGNNGFGDVYSLTLPVATDKGAATVLSVWIIRQGERFPRLVTCFIQ